VLTENLTGLARLVRMAVTPAMENVALWHERDISHSSVERMIGPDTTVTLDFALARLTGVIDKLMVYPERMVGNMDRLGGLVHSQRILLALTQAGSSREDAYRLVQRNAMKVWNSYQTSGDAEVDFLTELLNDEDVRKYLSETEIRDRFDLGYHTKHVDTIFARVFKERSSDADDTHFEVIACHHAALLLPPSCRGCRPVWRSSDTLEAPMQDHPRLHRLKSAPPLQADCRRPRGRTRP
jgi:adenylosuccinate lyase